MEYSYYSRRLLEIKGINIEFTGRGTRKAFCDVLLGVVTAGPIFNSENNSITDLA